MTAPIVTSRSAVSTYQQCNRRRYWAYEAENGTPVRGWERKALAIPLVTGIYVHKGLEQALSGNVDGAASAAKAAYLEEVGKRGLQVEEGTDEHAVIEEQAAHVEALVLAWIRVRLPKWQEDYELVEVEVEDRIALSEDVTLAVRADAIVRRKADHRMFVVNFKTVGTADERWLRAWEVDMQLMTELLAAERRHGAQFGGVIIEGLIKGRRMPEKDNVGTVTGYRDSTPLLYGYKVDANPPLQPAEYGWEYTRRKGWYRFPVWKEQFPSAQLGNAMSAQQLGRLISNLQQQTIPMSPLAYWINWLPEEVVEAQFTVVPPIMRDSARIESKVRQIVAMEQRIQEGNEQVSKFVEDPDYADWKANRLDEHFPMNEKSCVYPSRCPMWDACYTANVSSDMLGSGLYIPRKDHHAIEGGTE